MLKDTDFYHLREIYWRNIKNNYWILECFQKIFHKIAEATDELLGNKFANKIMKTKHVIDQNARSVDKNSYSTRKERTNIKRIKTSIIKTKHWKTSKLLSDSSVPKFMTKTWVKRNGLSSGQYSVNKNVRFNFNVENTFVWF